MRYSIVTIDDEETCLQILNMCLERHGYKVAGFINPGSALEYLKLHGSNVDLILSDMQMPGMSCAELLSLIKNDPSMQHIPVIVQSAASFDLIEQCLHLGASSYLLKPYTHQQLLSLVQSTISQSMFKVPSFL